MVVCEDTDNGETKKGVILRHSKYGAKAFTLMLRVFQHDTHRILYNK